ncbi:MAG: hypothetical protein ACKOEC_16205 [Acidimicrobiia bacterium]
MRMPPLLARLLLDWLAPGNEALRGDLDEEFAGGRSRRWYWRQVASAIANEGTLRVRNRAIHSIENYVTGFITLTMVAFYAVFVVNVTDWLLRFEGFQVLMKLPNALEPANGVEPLIAAALGAAIGQLIAAGHLRHRVLAVMVFGGTTMLCAATALKAASASSTATIFFLPHLVPQVVTTAMFVCGLLGGIAALSLRRPILSLGANGV